MLVLIARTVARIGEGHRNSQNDNQNGSADELLAHVRSCLGSIRHFDQRVVLSREVKGIAVVGELVERIESISSCVESCRFQ